jgi:hypothetical protein
MDSFKSFTDSARSYAKSNPNTMRYLMIALGVLAVVLIGWFIYKKFIKKAENFQAKCQSDAECPCATGKCAKIRKGNTLVIDCVADRTSKTGCKCRNCPTAAQGQVARK